MMSAVIAVGGAAVLFALFGIGHLFGRRETPDCACFGGRDHCDTCPNHLETTRE